MKFDIRPAVLQRAIAALEYQAHMEAGQSQSPDLIRKEDTQAWGDSIALRISLRAGRKISTSQRVNHERQLAAH
ncbi:hypothetical protein Lumi_086 [Xylophilus phage Lumi]|nr:hypothetical protein Lumi_086 [Xylophilus phage Lumi]